MCGCSAAHSQAGKDAETVSGIKAELESIRQEFRAGRDVNTGLSSRGITFIVLGAIACYAFVRWDLNHSNRQITRDAVAELQPQPQHSDNYRTPD